MRPSRLPGQLAPIGVLLIVLSTRLHAQTDDPGPPNVTWSLVDSISACPAGDSVFSGHSTHKHPSRLRISVRYTDANEEAKVGVPPESIWVSYTTTAGNLRVNGKGPKAYADYPTGSTGNTRITIPSFSGCGTLQVTLRVSGISQGSKSARVRTTDADASGRDSLGGDQSSPCDIDWSGSVTQADQDTAARHLTHWHRHVLHGGLVRRSSLCDTCGPEDPNIIGDGKVAWSPSGRYLLYDIDDPVIGCKLFIASSDPDAPTTTTQFTFATSPDDSADYDGSWSPHNTEIIFQRKDRLIFRKPVPWIGGAETGVYSDPLELPVTYPAVSPDGKTIAFTRFEAGAAAHVYTVPIEGGVPKQITTGSNVRDRYPEWSPDGRLLIFERRGYFTGAPIGLFKVAPGDLVPVMLPVDETTAKYPSLPSYSPDSQVVVSGRGADFLTQIVATRDRSAPATDTVGITSNYPLFTHGLPFPRFAPDGTRIGLLAKDPAIAAATSPQVWASRRNMNLPPRITQIGSQALGDTTPRVFINAIVGLPTTVTVTSTDPEPESGGVKCWVSYLANGMEFDTTTCTLSWTPTAPVGTSFTVKFGVITASGGSDATLAILTVVSGLLSGGGVEEAEGNSSLWPAPIRSLVDSNSACRMA